MCLLPLGKRREGVDVLEFRTYDDLSRVILQNMSRLPQDIDLVVGVPRSGLMVASMIALYRNLPLTSLDDFLEGRLFTPGRSKPKDGWITALQDARRILVVEDSAASGQSILQAREQIGHCSPYAERCVYLAAYVQESAAQFVDFYLEVLEQPRIFQWNFLQHGFLMQACFDIDGVLCEDPSPEQNDDGPRYREFLLHAPLKLRPQRPVRYLVTSRLERYRAETEQWLAEQQIPYEQLIMMDVATAAERRRLGNHAAFKAAQYRAHEDAQLFIESEDAQAREIFRLTNKPVFCIESQVYYCDHGREWRIAQTAIRKHRVKEFLKQFRLVRYANAGRKVLRRKLSEFFGGGGNALERSAAQYVAARCPAVDVRRLRCRAIGSHRWAMSFRRRG